VTLQSRFVKYVFLKFFIKKKKKKKRSSLLYETQISENFDFFFFFFFFKIPSKKGAPFHQRPVAGGTEKWADFYFYETTKDL